MKRKRGRKPGHKKAVKGNIANDLPKSPVSPNTEDNGSADQTDDAPLNSEIFAEQALPEPEKPSSVSNNMVDVSNVRPKGGAVYGRVRVKLKSSKVLESHQSSSDAQTPSDVDKSNRQVPEEFNEMAVDKDSGYSDGQTSDLRGADAEKMPRKVGSIKIKSKGLASVGDATQDKNTDKADDPPQTNKGVVMDNKRSVDLLLPNNLPGKEGKQSCHDARFNEKELTAALEAIKKVMKMDAAEPFNTPVDPVALGIPDYFDIIDTPMDFGTICHDLEHGHKYMNSEDVYKDVQFIWDNCSKYNSKGDYILELMKRVKKAFMKYWLAAGLYSDVPDNGTNDNTNNEDVVLASQEKSYPKSKSKHKRRRHGIDRHKSDCLCAVCVVTRRRREREDENQIVLMDVNPSEQRILEENSPVENPGSQDAASSGEQSPQNDTDEEIELEKEKKVEIPEHLKISQPIEETTGIQMEESLGQCVNNQPSDLLPFENGDEDSSQNSEEDDDGYKGSDKQEEQTSAQLNESTTVHHQQEGSIEPSKEVKMQDNPVQQENHSILQICASLFPSDRSSIWRGSRSLFQRPASLQESPIHAAMATIMKR